MARLRFTLRAYLAEGHAPDVALTLTSRQFDISIDDHFATVLVGVADVADRSLIVSSAGHFPPLIIDSGGAHYPTIALGPPLGVDPSWTYGSTIIPMETGSSLLAFTDGLIERRQEVLDQGLERLAKAAASSALTPEQLLDAVMDQVGADAEDDIALLAFAWDREAAPLAGGRIG
jgi:serine phosphatase RsbU (regulator of sigma subunit)